MAARFLVADLSPNIVNKNGRYVVLDFSRQVGGQAVASFDAKNMAEEFAEHLNIIQKALALSSRVWNVEFGAGHST